MLQFVFTDVKNKQIFVTTNYGHNVTRMNVNFTPNEVSFHEYESQVFLVLQKTDQKRQVRYFLIRANVLS